MDIHYPVLIPLQPAYAHPCYRSGTFTVTEHYAKQLLPPSTYFALAPGVLQYVAAAILEFVRTEVLMNSNRPGDHHES